MSSQKEVSENMFSEQEQNQLQSFLDNLDSVDTNTDINEESTSTANNKSKQKRTEKKRMAPYQKKVRSPSEESPSSPPRSKVGRVRKPAHELLSEDQKKANHIASEQKRRANIRIGFDQLVDMVPALDNCQRSEALILQKCKAYGNALSGLIFTYNTTAVNYIRDLVQDKDTLRERVRELQTVLGDIPDEDSSDGEMDYSYR